MLQHSKFKHVQACKNGSIWVIPIFKTRVDFAFLYLEHFILKCHKILHIFVMLNK